MDHRAYSVLEIKSVDEDTRTIRGIATTPTPDRMEDVVVPSGAQFKLPVPLLWQHDSGSPIGNVTEATVTERGIEIVAEIASGVTSEIDRAWALIKAKLVRGLSIGFRGIDVEQIKGTFGIKFNTWEWLELSAVTIPANAEASITSVKKFDSEPAALGNGDTADKSPGAPGKPKSKPVNLRQEAKDMTTLAEQITALENKRAANIARMDEVMQKSIAEGRSTNEGEQEEFANAESENETIDRDLKMLRSLEKAKSASAKPVNSAPDQKAGSEARAGVVIKREEKLEPGIAFARIAKVKAISHLDHESNREIAKRYYGEESKTYRFFTTKADVVAGSSIAENWAADLVGEETTAFADFVEFLRPRTILGRFGANGIPSLRRVPFRTALVGQTGGGQAYWVGEGKPKPLTAFDFSRTSLDELKIATISVVTEELIRKSSPSADAILRDALAAAVAERSDVDFIDPTKAADSGVSPASITNGVTPIGSTGGDAASIRADIRALFGTFIADNNTPSSGVWIMSSTTALALSLMQNPLGQAEFPGITMGGGTLFGLPVITSEYLAPDTDGAFVVLANAGDIYFADEGGVMVDVSREASLQMLDNPTNDTVTPTATTMVSMWQTNSVAFRAERILNWAKRRTGAVAVLNAVDWGNEAT